MGLFDDIPTCVDLLTTIVLEAAEALSKSTAMVSAPTAKSHL